MIAYPNAKINIGLRVLNRRPDGFHDIETLLYPIGLCDALEIVPAAEFSFTSSGIEIGGDVESNLCVKAFRMMQQRYALPNVKIHLHKVIPTGAGLGGGSSDAAFVLTLLRRVFKLKFCGSELADMAKTLGSDCNFFIRNVPVKATGRGDILEPIKFNLSGKHLVLVKPDFQIETPWAYQNIQTSGKYLPDVSEISDNPAFWNGLLENDFEPVVAQMKPEINILKQKLKEIGADYVSMSGSGSSVFGLFNQPPKIKDGFGNYFVWQEMLA